MSKPTTPTAHDARARLRRLAAERRDALDAGLGDNATYMRDLSADIAASRESFVGLAVTEIATFRAELSGRLEG